MGPAARLVGELRLEFQKRAEESHSAALLRLPNACAPRSPAGIGPARGSSTSTARSWRTATSRDRLHVLDCKFGLKSAHLAEQIRRDGFDASKFRGGLRGVSRARAR